jgi:hypothetical protein
MTRKIVYEMPDDFQPTEPERRTMMHVLSGLEREVKVLTEDGMAGRAVVVGLLVSAIKLAATSHAVTPEELRAMVDAIMKRYTEQGFEA